jgi:hypothetical protein
MTANVQKVGINRWRVRSHSDRRKRYTVTRRGRGFACSCPRWTFNVPRPVCGHIKDVKAGAQ